MFGVKPVEPDNTPHRSQERRPGNSIDASLRAAGYSIHSRPKGTQPLWRSRDGVVLTQEQALQTCKVAK
jgi:hypothetical protein